MHFGWKKLAKVSYINGWGNHVPFGVTRSFAGRAVEIWQHRTMKTHENSWILLHRQQCWRSAQSLLAPFHCKTLHRVLVPGWSATWRSRQNRFMQIINTISNTSKSGMLCRSDAIGWLRSFLFRMVSPRWSGSNYFDYMRLFHAVMDGNAKVLYDFNPVFFQLKLSQSSSQ